MRKELELTHLLWIAALVVAPLGLASCAPKEGEDTDEPEVATPSETETAEPVTVDIDEWKDSNVSGEATINRAGGNLNVAISLDELPAAGTFTADLVSGQCDAMENMATTTGTTGTPGANTKAPGTGTTPSTTPGTTPSTTPGTTPSTTPGATTTGMGNMPGMVLGSLGTIMIGTTTTPPAQPAPSTTTAPSGRTGTASGTVPMSALQGVTEAFIRVSGAANAPVACGNVDDLNKLTMAAGTVTPPSTVPSTTPAPGTRP
jgi:hypothetical protein